MDLPDIVVRIAQAGDARYAAAIVTETEASAKARGTGIAKRSPSFIHDKISQGDAVIAVTRTGEWVGFSYLSSWDNGAFVSNGGLIVNPAFRHTGVARAIKQLVFRLSRKKHPNAKLFAITTGAAVMKMNHQLGFKPVSFAEITREQAFWEGCRSCVNYPVLQGQCRRFCFCTALLFDPAEHMASTDEGWIY